MGGARADCGATRQDEHVAITAFHALRQLLANDDAILVYIGKINILPRHRLPSAIPCRRASAF